jgi:carbonic anhydrase
VDVIKVRHIIVCGHYGCGGVRAALRGDRHGLVDNWLRHVQDVRDKHLALLKPLDNEVERVDRLCELNVLEQVLNVCQTSIVRDAWQRSQELTVHSWIYGLHDGLLRDLGMAVSSWKEVEKAHAKAVASLKKPKRTPGSGSDPGSKQSVSKLFLSLNNPPRTLN